MTKFKQKSLYRSLSACALLLFAGMVMTPILSATGKAGAGKAAPAAEPAAPGAETPAAIDPVANTLAEIARRHHNPVTRLSPAQVGDYDGAEYAGTTGGGDYYYAGGGRGQPGLGTFAGTEIGGGAVPVLNPRNYVHYGSGGGGGRRGGPAGDGGDQPGGGGKDNSGPQPPKGGENPDQPGNPNPDPGPDLPEVPEVPEVPGGPNPPTNPPVVEVPEPSALALLVLGIAGLVFARRRAR